MTHKHILALSLAALTATTSAAQDAPARGELLEGINMFVPDEGEPAWKLKANEKYGTQWYADLAYGYWHSKKTRSDYNNNANMFLVHAALNQRLIKDDINGGTWLRAEFSGSWGLDKSSAKSDRLFTDAFGSTNWIHTDDYGPHDGVIPELAIMQYFAGKRACIIAGMVNLTNYFDCVSIANDSFSSFVNSGFVNSSVLALPDANAGAVLQFEINPVSYAMLGFSRETNSYGHNPFSSSGCSYLVVGEYGHTFRDGATTIRINPFFRQVEEEDAKRHNFGLAASVEHSVNDYVTIYARSGFGHKQELGNAFDFTCGANLKLIPSREDDFLGVAFGVFKPCTPADNNREIVLEAMYSLQLNDYFKLVPHVQYIANPAYDANTNEELITGIQAVFSF